MGLYTGTDMLPALKLSRYSVHGEPVSAMHLSRVREAYVAPLVLPKCLRDDGIFALNAEWGVNIPLAPYTTLTPRCGVPLHQYRKRDREATFLLATELY